MEVWVDEATDTLVRGWAWSPHQPEIPCVIELVSETGTIAAQTVADEFRGDLRAAGKRGGWCAFHLPLDATVPAGRYELRAQSPDAAVRLLPPFSHRPAPGDTPPPTPAREQADARHLSDGRGGAGYLEALDGATLRGWIHPGEPFGPLRRIALVVDGRVAATAAVDGWRSDVEDLCGGDGRAGFALDLPRELLDGAVHLVDLRWAGKNGSLLAEPLPMRLPAAATVAAPAPPPVPPRPGADAPVELSVLVNFFNMPREAARTLHSLSRAFQRDVGDLAYEVICIDNGSTPAMTEAEVTGHGPEFRLFRPERPHPSPVFALNAAAATARGRFVALMIDGAHLLSPGVLAEAVAALRAEPRAMVAVRHWFIGGDQRWLSAIGYGPAHEEVPFAKIGWPHCGYDLFKISAPIFDSPNTWFDSLSESNCLFLSAADLAALGGYDEAFDVPGAGFANLDLFARAAQLPGMAVVALIGEATFHQYHGGTTTNVSDAEKERRVRHYASSFHALRQESFAPVDRARLRFRGSVRTDHAMNARQRPSARARLGLTAAIRPVPLARTLDAGARGYASASYVEAGGHLRATWAGEPTGVAPADLLEIQQMLWEDRPDVLVLRDVAPGLLDFVRSILPAIRLEGVRLVWLTRDAPAAVPPGVIAIGGDLAQDGVEDRLVEAIGSAEGVAVMFQPRDDEPLPAGAIRRCARFVSQGGTLLVLGGGFGQPHLGYSTRWISNAIHRFLEAEPGFRVDPTRNAHVVTTCPSGFLRRLPLLDDEPYDASLDMLEGVAAR